MQGARLDLSWTPSTPLPRTPPGTVATATSPVTTASSTSTCASPRRWAAPGGATNPEELFAAGYAACFHSAMKLVAGQQKLDVEGTQVSASIGIGPLDDGGFGLKADLVVYAPKLDRATAQSLVEAAHKVCPYSNATRGNIDVSLSVVE